MPSGRWSKNFCPVARGEKADRSPIPGRCSRASSTACFGSWQTVYTWHNRMAKDGTWDVILQRLLTQADTEDLIDWSVSVDSTITRAHQHATNIRVC